MICKVCSHESHARELYVKWHYAISRCPDCGVGSVRVPEDYDPTSIYDDGYFHGGRRDGYADYKSSELVIRAESRRVLSRVLRLGPTNGRLLEIGCGVWVFSAGGPTPL